MPSLGRPTRSSRNARPKYDDSSSEQENFDDDTASSDSSLPPRKRPRKRATRPSRRNAAGSSSSTPNTTSSPPVVQGANGGPMATAQVPAPAALIVISSDDESSTPTPNAPPPPLPANVPIANTLASGLQPIPAEILAGYAELSDESSHESSDEIENVINTPSMSTIEKRKRTLENNLYRIHPELQFVWDELKVPPKTEPMDQPEFLNLKLLPYQKEGLSWLVRQEEEFGGGLLADEMGMGKTISMIALMLIRRRSPTLLVAPTVAIKQWMSELTTHVHPDGRFSIVMFHGAARSHDPELLSRCDILITSYSVLESCFRKEHYGARRKGVVYKEPSPLHSIEWERIILDESHAIKDRVTNTARAAFNLEAKTKWALSGTPLQNRVGELYSVIRFLRLDPFGYYFCRACPCKSLYWNFTNGTYCVDCGHRPMQHFSHWNMTVLKPIQNNGASGEGLAALDKLGRLLDKYMLRRTKDEKADDLGLPPRHIVVRSVRFNDEEMDFYTSLFSDSKRQFATYVAAGTVLNNYANIFDLITKMRQAADHPDLILSRLKGKQQEVCGICHDSAEDPVVSKCKHVFCREDVRQYLDSAAPPALCPVCFTKLVVNLDVAEVAVDKPTPSIVNKIDMDMWRSSSKIEALVEELHRLKQENYTTKSIVFSQYVSFLDLIRWRLKRANFECVKLDGCMTLDRRDSVIKAFMTNPSVTVFLISLKAGGVALNLTEASHVFLMDPWWNPAAEDQAMDRIHRLGQYRPIRITRIIIQDSIEERIIQLQAKKKALFQSTVGKDVDALARLSEDDLKFLFVL